MILPINAFCFFPWLECAYISLSSLHIFSSRELLEIVHVTLKIIESTHEKINPYYMDKLWNLNRTIRMKSLELRKEQYSSNDTYEHTIFVNMSTV